MLNHRKRVYGENDLPTCRKTLLQLMTAAVKDNVLILLPILAAASLALVSRTPVNWFEGVAIMVLIAIAFGVDSVNDWLREHQFNARNEPGEVIRDDTERVVDIKEVLVGDIALVEPGDILPADGIFISGHNVKCGESGATGASEAIKKLSYTTLRTNNKKTPPHIKHKTLAELIREVGSMIYLVVFAALMTELFVPLDRSLGTSNELGIELLNAFIIPVALLAVPEGLTLAVSLALSFATKRMVNENMVNASVICADRGMMPSRNTMTVVAGSVGIHAKFVHSLNKNHSWTNAEESVKSESGVKRRYAHDFSIDQAKLNTIHPNELLELFNEAIALNSTAFEDVDPMTGQEFFVGGRTEAALLQLAKDLNWRNAEETRTAADIVQMIPFTFYHKVMAVVIRKPQGYRAYFKGASQILADKSTKHIVVGEDGTYSCGIETKEMDELSRQNTDETIIFYANQTLRTLALCYRDFDSWPPIGTTLDSSNEVSLDDLAKDLTLIAITAIEDRFPKVSMMRGSIRPASKMADVGFSMGITGTEVAKEISDIILMDDNFTSTVMATEWGRWVHDSGRKFLHFQISTNITAVVITLISFLVDPPILSAVQLLWVNIFIVTFAALALVIDPGREKVLNWNPDKKMAPLVTVKTCKMVLLQSVYQIVIILGFHFFGLKILELEDTPENRDIVKSLVFNAFAFAQMFDSVNCSRLDSKPNIFEGILRNKYIILISLIEIAVQVFVNFFGGAAFKITKFGGREWGISIALGFICIPWGFIIRFPMKPFEWLFKAPNLVREEKEPPGVEPDRGGWGDAISLVRDNLDIFHVRGRRFRSKTRMAPLSRHDEIGISSILDRAPTLLAKPLISQPVVDHVSEVLDKIRADTIHIVGWQEPIDPSPNIQCHHGYSEILEVWKEIESLAQRPAEFLSIWSLVEDYERCIHELQHNISAHTMTEDMDNDFRRRLSVFVRAFKASAKGGDIATERPSQVPSADYSPAFFKGIKEIAISGGNFVMNVTQTVPKSSDSSQSETYLKEIRNSTYFRTFIELAILF